MSLRFHHWFYRYIPFLIGSFFFNALNAHAQGFHPASHQSSDVPLRIEKTNARLQHDITALPELPKIQKTAFIEEYTERADSLKSALLTGQFLLDTLWDNWFQGIVTEIYRGNPWLPATDITLYVGRGEEPNAWSIGEGSLVFNIGLLPFMEDESEAAFIVCHEMAHYVRNHGNIAIEQYITNLYSKETQKKLKALSRDRIDKTERAMKLIKGMTYDNRRHSRFKETEADSLGFVLLSNTKYDPNAAWEALRILDTIDNINWPNIQYKALLDVTQYPFQDSWLADPPRSSLSMQAAAFQDTPFEADSLKTHPDCPKRMALIKRQMGAHTGQISGSKFLQRESTFQQLKTLSGYEMIEALYGKREYGRCLFRTLILLQQNPEDAYLNAMVVKCLYFIHRYEEAHDLRSVLDLPRPGYSKEYKAYLQFVNRLQLGDIAKIGYYFCQNRLEKYSGNEDFVFAAALASSMNALPDEFNTRKTQYLKEYPTGRFINTLNTITH